MALVQAKQEVLFVVTQGDIVAGAVFFDQLRFQEQGFFFRGGGQGVQAGGLPEHGLGFGGQGGDIGREIRRYAAAQAFGLAHINDFAPGGLE